MLDIFDALPEIQGWPDDKRPRLGWSKPKVPEPNRKLEKMQLTALQRSLKQAGKGFEIPAIPMPRPMPPPAPPPTSSSADVQEAGMDARRQAGRRTGHQSTIIAGETGGYKTQSLGGNLSILG